MKCDSSPFPFVKIPCRMVHNLHARVHASTRHSHACTNTAPARTHIHARTHTHTRTHAHFVAIFCLSNFFWYSPCWDLMSSLSCDSYSNSAPFHVHGVLVVQLVVVSTQHSPQITPYLLISAHHQFL